MHAEEEALHADPTGTNPVSVDPDLAIVTAIIFLVLLAVLWKFAWGPILEAIERREQTVADNLAEAQRSTEEARRLLAEHESTLAGAAAEVKHLLEQGRRDAERQKQQIIEEAHTAAQSEKQRALREIDAAKNAALQDLARSSVDTAVHLAGKIVQRELSAADHARLIGDALQEFPSDN
jgi:F-type H+-transporting ATPase subunit b